MLKTILNYSISVLFYGGGAYSLYAIPSLIKTLINIIRKKYDELERKSVFDSLAISMLVITTLHLIQFLLGYYFNFLGKPSTYLPIISPGIPFGSTISSLGHYPYVHMDSIFLDFTIISLVFNIKRYRYGLITKKQFLKPIIIVLLIFIPIGVFSFITNELL